jgi:epoxide hydrolase 4
VHPERVERLVIVNAPHPAIFDREIRENPAQQSASRYMLTFRSPEAEGLLAADNYARLVEVLSRDLGERFTTADRAAYLEAWSQPRVNRLIRDFLGPRRAAAKETR